MRAIRAAVIAALLMWLPHAALRAADAPGDAAQRCAQIAHGSAARWPEASTRIVSASLVAQGSTLSLQSAAGPGPIVTLPEHCEVIGVMQERLGEVGQHYAIGFHLRLPTQWNGRFLFVGGGGSNGQLGDALGSFSFGSQPALLQGYAVVSQDSGHDNRVNNDPTRGGVLAFGFDEQARANYGGSSLPLVSQAAKAIVRQFYGQPAQHAYFVGCSKGGEEGMALAQRYADEFDGIAANAPGMSLPRAALAEAWDTQAFAAVLRSPGDTNTLPVSKLSSSFSADDFKLVRAAVLAACDADDGLRDGIVGDFSHCTTPRVRRQLLARQCKADPASGCLSAAQISALLTVMGGVRDQGGHALYSDWPWDAGIAAPDWRVWKIGAASGTPPSLNVVLGGASLASVFTTPPTALSADPQLLFNFLLAFDMQRDAPKIYASNEQFPRSAWQDIAARSSDLSAFRARHGRLLVVQGVSDPVFSVNDTIAWWREVDQRNDGHGADFVRLFPVPGMNHCGGGFATDQFDVLNVLTQWVEQNQAPDRIIAGADPRSPWPQRTRPLCPYPQIARYKGSGDGERADSFMCAR